MSTRWGSYLRGMHINWGFLSGVTVWGCNLRGLISGVILRAPTVYTLSVDVTMTLE